jgi:putative NIF3 family GTP cyclohydrolase 1 type 2
MLPNRISRGLLLIGLFTIFIVPAQGQPQTVRSVVDRMIENKQTPIQKGSVDTLIVGRWNQEVTGIATTFMATFDVIKRAQRKGLNLVLTHEPTFYNHRDERDVYGINDPVVLEKLRFIEENNMVVFRYHDLPHAASVDLIEAGFSADLGWSEFEIGEGKFQSPFKSLGELADFLKIHFQSSTIRVVGDRNMAISTMGIQLGAAGRLTQVSRLNEEIDVLIIGEAREWETIEYARDALEMGGNTALIVLGHVDSEEPGMEYVAKWLKELIPEVPVQFVPAGNPLWTPH